MLACRAQELLAAAQQELDYAQDRKEAAEAELAMEHPDLNFDDAEGEGVIWLARDALSTAGTTQVEARQ